MNPVYILVEAKKEYTNQLQKILTPRLYEGFKSIYEDILQLLSNEVEEKNIQSSSIIKTFQKTLREIPQWNQEMIKKEYYRIEKISNCDYFEDLLEAIFITNTKILTSVQVNDKDERKIKINIPQGCNFIHKCYMECAKEIYKNPYIYDQSKILAPKEKHNNLREALSLIELSINNAIRDLLPIRDILRQGITKFNNNEEMFNSEDEVSGTEISLGKHNKEDTEDAEDAEDAEDTNKDENNNDEEDTQQNEEKEKTLENQINLEIPENQEISIIELEENIPKIVDIQEQLEENNLNSNQIILLQSEDANIDANIEGQQEEKKEVEQFLPQEEIKQIILSKEPIKKEIKEVRQVKEMPMPVPKKTIVLSNDKVVSNGASSSAFIKEINPKKFLKNKYVGGDKNSSFYKKKYEENSANYHSISDLTPTLTNLTKESLITKNKIMIEDNSSDESDGEIVLD